MYKYKPLFIIIILLALLVGLIYEDFLSGLDHISIFQVLMLIFWTVIFIDKLIVFIKGQRNNTNVED